MSNSKRKKNVGRVKWFLFEPWRTSQARAAVLVAAAFAIIIGFFIAMLAYPDDKIPVCLDIVYVFALIAAFFLVVCAKTITRNNNVDLIRGVRITWFNIISGAMKAPLKAMVALGFISEREQMLLITPNRQSCSRPAKDIRETAKRQYVVFADWHIASVKFAKKSRDLIAEVHDTRYPVTFRHLKPSRSQMIGTAARTRPRGILDSDQHFKSFADFKDHWKVMDGALPDGIVWGVVFAKNPISKGLAPSDDNIIGVLDMLGVLTAAGVTHVVAISSDEIDDDKVKSFFDEGNCKTVYDEIGYAESHSSDIPGPLVPISQLEPKFAGDSSTYRWEGELPDAFAKIALDNEFLQLRSTIGTMFRIMDGSSRAFTRTDIVNLATALSLGHGEDNMSKLPESAVAEPKSTVPTVLITKALTYDPEANPVVAAVHDLRQEAEDLVLLWSKVLNKSNMDTVFLMDTEKTDADGNPDGSGISDVRSALGQIGEMIGMESFLEAYYAGVPVSDIIA